MVRSVLGFPRMGVNRDLKKATEAYWAGKLSQDDLLAEGKRLRLAHWKIQKDAGIDVIPSNDFSFYDHVLNHIQLFGVSSSRLSILGMSTLILHRLFPKDTPNTICLPSKSSSPWVGVFRDQPRTVKAPWMFRVWYVLRST